MAGEGEILSMQLSRQGKRHRGSAEAFFALTMRTKEQAKGSMHTPLRAFQGRRMVLPGEAPCLGW